MVGDVRIRTGGEQGAHGRKVALLHGEDQRRFAAVVGDVRIRPAAEQDLDALHEADLRRMHQRRRPVLGAAVHVRAIGDQEVHPGAVAALGDHDERRIARIHVAHVEDRRARLVDDRFRLGAVTLLHGLEEGVAVGIMLRSGRNGGEDRERGCGGGKVTHHRHRLDP